MPRPRINDPLGVSDNPDCATDPEVIADLLRQIGERLNYVARQFTTCSPTMDATSYNQSLADMKRALEGRKARGGPRRLNPQIEFAVSFKAREFAAKRGCDDDASVTREDKQRAVQWAAKVLKPISNRPRAEFLRHHVEGVMALLQEYYGRPVRVGKTRNSVYEPHFKEGMSRIIPRFFMELDPTITETQLVNIVLAARKKYRGRPMYFRDFFPGYGLRVPENGQLVIPGHIVEKSGLNFPTYCP